VLDIGLDQRRAFLYSAGADQRLCVINLNHNEVLTSLKVADSTLKAMTVSSELRMMFVSTTQGQIFIFSIEKITPIIVNTIKLAENLLYAKALQVDSQKNLLFALSVNSLVAFY